MVSCVEVMFLSLINLVIFSLSSGERGPPSSSIMLIYLTTWAAANAELIVPATCLAFSYRGSNLLNLLSLLLDDVSVRVFLSRYERLTSEHGS